MDEFKHMDGYVSWCLDGDEDNIAYIDYIEAYQKQCKKGRKVLRAFLKMVKNEFKVDSVTLIASDSFGTPLDSLFRFYSSFGFKVVQENSFGKTMRKEF